MQAFDELTMPWVRVFLKSLATLQGEPETVALYFTQFAALLHKKLSLGFEGRSKEANLLMSKREKFAQVPDMYDYAQLWLCLQLLAAKR